MLMISKCIEVFQLSNARVPDLLSAKTKEEFFLAKENIQRWFKSLLKSGAAKLNNPIPTKLVPNPKNYIQKMQMTHKKQYSFEGRNSKAWILHQQSQGHQVWRLLGMSNCE